MENKYYKILYLFTVVFIILGCSDKKNDYKIINNSYKGLGVFLYFEIDGGSLYEVKFIPFHFNDKEIGKSKHISLKMINSNSDNIIFEKGISFGSFKDRNNILYSIFKNSQTCGDINYCFVYIDFKENEQNVIDKLYKKRGYSSNACVNGKNFKVVYDPTQIYVEDLIKIKTLNIIN